MAAWLIILIIVLIFLIAAIPLHLAAHLLGGQSSLLKAALTNIAVGIVGALIYIFLPWIAAGIIYFIVVLVIYKAVFSIGWIRAFLVWLIAGIIAFVFWMMVIWIGIIAL